MLAKILSVVLVCAIPGVSLAQLSSSPLTSVNGFGRYFGFGYSDGYHACKDATCKTASQAKACKSISTLHDTPSLISNDRMIGRHLDKPASNHDQGTYVETRQSPSLPNQLWYPTQRTTPLETTQLGLQPQPQTPRVPPGASNWSPSSLIIEPYAPTTKPSQISPSDRGN